MKTNQVTSGSAIEWHYAPMTGVLGKRRDGQWENTGGGWAKHHEDMAEFLRLRAAGDLILKEIVNYGHPHFHGHSGRVDVYSPNGASQTAAPNVSKYEP